eukprot:421270-Rhodomonas_salina.1
MCYRRKEVLKGKGGGGGDVGGKGVGGKGAGMGLALPSSAVKGGAAVAKREEASDSDASTDSEDFLQGEEAIERYKALRNT